MLFYLIIGTVVLLISLFLSFFLVKQSKKKLTVQHRLFMVRRTKELNKYSVLLLLASAVFYFLFMKRLEYPQKETVFIYIILACFYIIVFIYSIIKEIFQLRKAALNFPTYILSRFFLLGGVAFFILFFYLSMN